MGPYAQTNLQLYRQLEELGYEEEEIARIHRAYELAMRLFSGLYRASGKPFVAHLIGTASVLAVERARAAVIIAGLLHAAYVQGDFGDGLPEPTPRHRARLRDALGEDAEALVSEYATFPWTAGDASGEQHGPGTMSDVGRDLLLIRLANEIDDLMDRGILYHADAERRRMDVIRATPGWTAWARSLSAERLASALTSAAEDSRTARITNGLRSKATQSFRLPPVPPPALWRRILRRVRSRLFSRRWI